MLESLPGVALLVNKRGEILRLNQKDAQTPNGIEQPASGGGLRLKYEDYLRNLVGTDADQGQAHAIQDVISAQRETTVVELPLREQQKWIAIRAIQLPGAKGGSLVVHLDITQRKNAELEQNKSREEIYHLNRVAAMGQLAGRCPRIIAAACRYP